VIRPHQDHFQPPLVVARTFRSADHAARRHRAATLSRLMDAYAATRSSRHLDLGGRSGRRRARRDGAPVTPALACNSSPLARLQSLRRVNWVVFTHVGIARAQLKVPRQFRRPYAVFLHGIESWSATLDADRRAALRGARVRIAISPHTARRVAAAHPDLPAIETCLLALLPDDEAPDRIPADVRVDYGPHAVVIVGRMSSTERYKGHDPLILAWPRVLAEVPNASLVIVGRGDDVERLRTKAAALGLGRSVHFPGFRPTWPCAR
jgi:glycosyltransferase involved in cell wall biosynthesis